MNIISQTTVNELLKTFPQLLEVLVDLNPQFNKLENPILRKTMGRVATLQQASQVAGIPALTLINHLREAVGQEPLTEIEK